MITSMCLHMHVQLCLHVREREREGSAQGNRTFLEQSLAFEATS